MLSREPVSSVKVPGWRWSRISAIAKEVRERAGTEDRHPVLSVTKHRGIVLASEYFKKPVHGQDLSNYKLVRRGQLAYATIHLNEGSIGLLRNLEAGLVSPMYTVFEVNGQLDPEYLLLLLKSPRSQSTYQRLSQGTVNRRAAISFSALGKLFIQHPALHEQRKIVSILSSVEEAINKSDLVLQRLHQLRQAMRNTLFSDGVPGQQVEPRNTELGLIPSHWEIERLENLCEKIVVGIVVKPAALYSSVGVLALRSKNIREDRIDLRDTVRISNVANADHYKSRLRAGDVVTVRTGVPGTSCTVPADLDGANCIDLIVTTPGPRILGAFLSRFLNTDRAKEMIARHQTGLAQQHFNVTAMKKLFVPVPPIKEQERIVEILEAIEQTARAEENERKRLVETRTAVADALLSGKIRVTRDETTS